MTIEALYTAEAYATGGRDGRAATADGSIDLRLDPPKEMGGKGAGNNPEQLFAAGYAACYIGAMKFATTQDKSLAKVPADTKVTAHVGIGPRSDGGFGLKVDLTVSMPGLTAEEAQAIADAGHAICPYSNAVKGNVAVTTTIA